MYLHVDYLDSYPTDNLLQEVSLSLVFRLEKGREVTTPDHTVSN